jgi:hypothetical protein
MQICTDKLPADSTDDIRCREDARSVAVASAHRVIAGLAALGFCGVVELRFEMGCLIAFRKSETQKTGDLE